MELSNAEIWAILGVLLIAIEIFSPTFFTLFLGIGALATSFLAWIGVLDSVAAQLVVFAVVSGASLLIFRKQLKASFLNKGESYDEFEGERATVISTILPNGEGKVFFRGADWIAYSDDNLEIPIDSHVAIKKADGIRLLVQKI